MDHYDANTVFSSIDHGGRYAHGNQPAAAQWNLARFAETLLPFIGPDMGKSVELATAVVKDFMPYFDARLLTRMRRKIGLANEQEGDAELVSALFATMQSAGADFTLTFGVSRGVSTNRPMPPRCSSCSRRPRASRIG
jgi:serine/tyrosine/threonine adenylyltransferase